LDQSSAKLCLYNMKLEVLDELISESLHPRNLINKAPIPDQQFENWNSILLQEKERIRKRLKQITYGYSKESHRRLYIQQHQSAIARLKNQLVDFLMPKDATVLAEQEDDVNLVRLYKRCLIALDELMNFLRDEFRPYFNDDEKMPACRLLIIQQELKPRLVRMRKYL